MKKILGLDLGTNSIGWSLISQDFEKKEGKIDGMGVRIIPMGQDVLGKFDAGQSFSQTAERTGYRGIRRLYERDNLRRDRLHRVLNVLGFLPEHYADGIDFQKKLGQFKNETEVKLNYRRNELGKNDFLFMNSFHEMVEEFQNARPELFYTKSNGEETKIPYDWTIYYLRKKALREKISKEEFAWLILNFNQKRGYYQLRGEEVEEKRDRRFVVLKVKSVLDSGEKVKGKILYDVVFENGWPYDRQITKIEDWVGRSKEFIVTISTLKSGETKYSYKSVDSEKDWIAIKAKTEQDIEQSGKTVGEYIYDTLLRDPKQKIRGKLVKTVERKFYKSELGKILSKQIELQPALFSVKLYQECIEELYPRNEGHQNRLRGEGFEHLFLEDIIFYQRPLKSQKSNISGCQFESRAFQKKNSETGRIERKIEPIPVISKSHPLYQEFRLWQWIQNLRIFNSEKIENGKLEDVTTHLLPNEDAFVDLFEFLNTKQTIESKQLIDFFVKKKLIEKSQKDKYRWNYVYDDQKKESKKYPMAETRVQFVNRLEKVVGLEEPARFLAEKTSNGNALLSREEQLWHIIYSVSDIEEYKKALTKFACKHEIDQESFLENFIKFPPFDSEYGSYSKKALLKLVPLMRMGRYWSQDIIPQAVRERADSIMERVNALPINKESSDRDNKEALAKVSDDDITKQLVKSFVPLKGKNPLKGLNTFQAAYLVYERHSEIGEVQQWKSPDDIDRYLKEFKQHSLRNPIVEQIVTETLRVVRDIWKYYGNGAGHFFDEIHVELGREMKNPAKKREEIAKRNAENENTNHRIKELLKEMMDDPEVRGDIRFFSPSHQELLKLYEEGVYSSPDVKYDKVSEDEISKIRRNITPSQREIQRYRLWLDQGYISPYTGKTIPLTKLFTHEYEVEHIIPRSRYFDNSLTNKIICESAVNSDKDNQTAFEYFNNKGGSIVGGHQLLSLDQYENHVNRYFRTNRAKLKNLLSLEIPEGFINRQMNDSRYISSLVKGLLSNLVREDGEREATSKNLVPVIGTITSKLKQDWGLHDKWNEIVAPRFKRLNELTQSEDFGNWDSRINAFRIQVPEEFNKGFNVKRIDHRHHALDALVVACTTRNHTHYLSALNAEKENFGLKDKLLIKNEYGHYTKTFLMPWPDFTIETKDALEKTIISFKQNLRVINKANNKFWSYRNEEGELNLDSNGKPKKKLRKQTKGDNWAIRKPLHKETVSGIYRIDTPKGKIATAVRTSLSEIKTDKHLAKVTDERIREVILPNHLAKYRTGEDKPDYERAFSSEGIEDLNKNIRELNNGKCHQPIFKVKMFEVGSKFLVGERGNKTSKYVEAAKGTNLFFAVYWDKGKQKRNFETVPLNEVIAHQKQVAHMPKAQRTPIQPKPELGALLFTLSPNDLVYVPSDEELENGGVRTINSSDKDQIARIYKIVSFTGARLYAVPMSTAKSIANKVEYTQLNKIEFIGEKAICIKLLVDRLGNIIFPNKPTDPDGNPGNGNPVLNEPMAAYKTEKKIQISKSLEDSGNSQLSYWAMQNPNQRFRDFAELMNRFYEFVDPNWKGKKIILDR
ncbi:type II CRISPR RNA-guided endonuclease Cas9 [Algoriphagus halophytocola]|uniref:CRISPR-associated endonuclease Cas9 n=1 Tax=Algoriphagus halophytocola TaxID=2991499 RepID=A0ABY6MLC9_9BACT|nr:MULTISPECIES: type II CRISPR RNA-guided endonuclease Cas9 [unclassified Algoriphagus]UZD24555.1 type II CRISPR RNA-guided endonuclease Cas9 [Algoriphagus sp. TR-M5]WBL41920.1 type II CRISPR RNA-guided endonuclease Cas9 [Algoriphagus sp. TR-M9]